MAKEAYRSYILAYDSHSSKDIFNVQHLDLQVQLLEYIILYNDFIKYCLNWYYVVKLLCLGILNHLLPGTFIYSFILIKSFKSRGK